MEQDQHSQPRRIKRILMLEFDFLANDLFAVEPQLTLETNILDALFDYRSDQGVCL